MEPVVRECRALAEEKQLQLTYLHQPGHRSSRCGRHDLARFNACADLLAGEGAGGQGASLMSFANQSPADPSAPA
jgi:hypothetical protein